MTNHWRDCSGQIIFEAKKYTRDSGRVINDPPNLLELRSKKFIIFQGRMGGCSKMLKRYEKDLDESLSLFQHSKTIWVLCLQFRCWKGLKPPIYFGLLGNQETHVNCKMTNSNHFNFLKAELILPFEINKLLPERPDLRLLSFLSSEKMFSSKMPFTLIEERPKEYSLDKFAIDLGNSSINLFPPNSRDFKFEETFWKLREPLS